MLFMFLSSLICFPCQTKIRMNLFLLPYTYFVNPKLFRSFSINTPVAFFYIRESFKIFKKVNKLKLVFITFKTLFVISFEKEGTNHIFCRVNRNVQDLLLIYCSLFFIKVIQREKSRTQKLESSCFPKNTVCF